MHIYLSIYVYMYICLYTDTYIHTCTHTHTIIYTYAIYLLLSFFTFLVCSVLVEFGPRAATATPLADLGHFLVCLVVLAPKVDINETVG